jgi:hypothetical protein
MSRRREAPGSSPYVCAKIAYLRGRKSRYSSLFLAYLRPISKKFAISLSTYSIFEAMGKKKKLKKDSPWWHKWRHKIVNCNHDEHIHVSAFKLLYAFLEPAVRRNSFTKNVTFLAGSHAVTRGNISLSTIAYLGAKK